MIEILPPSYSISNTYSRNPNSITEGEFRKLIAKEKLTYPEVNERYKMSPSTYNRLLKKYGFTPDKVRLRERREQELIKKLNEGASISSIAEEYNISVSRIKNILSDMGVSYRREEAVNEATLNKIKEAVSTGASIQKIAKDCGLSPGKLTSILDKLGLTTKRQAQQEVTLNLKKSTLQEWINKYKTIGEIAANVNISYATIKKYIKYFDLHI